jgi:hypothetical protein
LFGDNILLRLTPLFQINSDDSAYQRRLTPQHVGRLSFRKSLLSRAPPMLQ